ncbi:sarcolemmal membrane-associated protein-like isoform X1 [Scleropages formosus]|uniref:Sarcolemmal membrane-associated protein n=2 Tax=Scleropages formosus TaxID=113540 RepID=A0A8C9U1R9_SCLFO|nr:sarcolemmal membrane-associated protein-like isoform X1 [Scleropages formosus]
MPSALAVFTCRPNSHAFQERHVYLDEPVRIGRSVARCRPTLNNATFDCKVLSRNHALVWFDRKMAKFYLQDTRSSNGTFVNSQRLSRGSEESPPCEVLSGDVIQFGVDVTENTRKVTHGCIVSVVKLFLPDGVEAPRRSDVTPIPLALPVDKVTASTPSMCSQELFQLSQYLQEALHREQMLEQKLATLQRLLTKTQEASKGSWQALIDEDRLLSRLEMMGSQLQVYSKSQTEDSLRRELEALQEDKHKYETTAKESLRRVLQEKMEVVRKLSEVERSLSNTEDECTHLREMSEAAHKDLRELASKYNGALKEGRELAEKLKLAEKHQEELAQSSQREKAALQLHIAALEEREQTLQARIEALQADNDFTNERLTALNVRLEQLQEKSLKGNSLENLLLKSGGDCTFIQQFIEYQRPFPPQNGIFHLPSENRIDVKESATSDTLSLSKDKSSEDTTDEQMDNQELNESFSQVTLVKDELQHSDQEPVDATQVIQNLQGELCEAQELANTSQQKCMDLQAALEEERRMSRKQMEDSARQIHTLQAQLHKLQVDMEELQEQKENAIADVREELCAAQEEALTLRRAVQAAAAERDHEIAAMQKELGTVTAELEKWRKAATSYELEIGHLQSSLQQQSRQCQRAVELEGELEKLQAECLSLQQECADLRSEKENLLKRLQELETELIGSQEQSASLSSSLQTLEKSRGELENSLGSLEEQHRHSTAKLQAQLAQAQSRTKDLQKEYEETQTLLSSLKERIEQTEQEKQSISDELQQCRSDLKQLQDKGGNRSWAPWMSAVAVIVAVTVGVLYPGLVKSSA